jgi:hypothetical protein
MQAAAARDAERAAARQAEKARIDAVMKSIDDSKRMLQETVTSLQSTVTTMQLARDEAARDLARSESMLASYAAQVDSALTLAIQAATAEGLIPSSSSSAPALPAIAEDEADVDDVAVATLGSCLASSARASSGEPQCT